jgi:hypothetical protein
MRALLLLRIREHDKDAYNWIIENAGNTKIFWNLNAWCVCEMFSWWDTPQGELYWQEICDYLEDNFNTCGEDELYG